MSNPWLSVVGLGEEGVCGLSPPARRAIQQAVFLIGGRRHLRLVGAKETAAKRHIWPSPLREAFSTLRAWRGNPVCVLASGDPMDYGIGVQIAQHFAPDERVIYPVAGAFSLACARLGWARSDTQTLSLHGRPLTVLDAYLRGGARLLVLCQDGKTPHHVAEFLQRRGFGRSLMTALSHLGGSRETQKTALAHSWPEAKSPDLVTLALDCRREKDAPLFSRATGLPDSAFDHDGQITKQALRAITLSSLAPLPGHLLWDIGAGCGSIAIEWLRTEPRAEAITVEKNPHRAALIAGNALTLGVSHLRQELATAPTILGDLPPPDRVFIGGGLSGKEGQEILNTCWQALRPGGRLVANAITQTSRRHLSDFALSSQDAICSFLETGFSHGTPDRDHITWQQKHPVIQMIADKSPQTQS